MAVTAKDKWKKKKWFKIFAPKLFDGKELGETVADDPKKVLGRTIEGNIRNLTASAKRTQFSVRFRISKIEGSNAYTDILGHEVPRVFIARFVKRESSKIEDVQFIKTKDGKNIKIVSDIITDVKANKEQASSIRKALREGIMKESKSRNFDDFFMRIVDESINKELKENLSKIMPIKIVILAKTEVMAEE
jgi:small subunit ribosomal protein S3Ae